MEETQETTPKDIDLDAPLALLTSVSSRLLSGEIPTNPSRLQTLFDHIQSVVGDVVDASFAKITDALDQVEEATEALVEEGEESTETHAFLEEFETGREHIEEGLAIMHETFFSAQNFDDLEEMEEEFREAEIQLAEGLGRLETAMGRAEDPDLFGLSESVSSIHVEEALEAFSSSLEALNEHMEDGEASHLETVLDYIEVARQHVEDALEAVEETETEENEASDDE